MHTNLTISSNMHVFYTHTETNQLQLPILVTLQTEPCSQPLCALSAIFTPQAIDFDFETSITSLSLIQVGLWMGQMKITIIQIK